MKKYRKPHRFKKKKPFWQSRFFGSGILIIIIVGVLFYFLFIANYFQIKKIIITGQKEVSANDLKLSVEKELEKRILFLKTKSIFLAKTKKIKESILINFPQIAEVKIKREFPDALNIIATERLGLAFWCQREQCFLLDGEGIIFETISENQSEMPKIRKKDEEESPQLREVVVEKEKLSKILTVESKLKKERKILIEEILIVSEQRFNIKTSEDWEIYFSFKEDLDWQLTKLGAVLEKEIPPEKRERLEYIDVRFGNFAPYKYKN